MLCAAALSPLDGVAGGLLDSFPEGVFFNAEPFKDDLGRFTDVMGVLGAA